VIYSDIQILRALASGHIVCRPLRVENVRGASIDLTLGEFFWRCDARPGGVFNPYDEEDIGRYFDGPFQAKPYKSVYEKIGWRECGWPKPAGYETWVNAEWGSVASKSGYVKLVHPFGGIPEDWPVIVLRPGERILAHTHEFVGIYSPGTSQLHARSSTGRIGIKVCDDAGLGDPGYVNRWTLEMRNDNREAVILPVGERLAQINFYQTGPTREQYGSETLYASKYQGSGDIEEIISNWSPHEMLPRNYQDRRSSPQPTDVDSYRNQLRAVREVLRAQRLRKAEVIPRLQGEKTSMNHARFGEQVPPEDATREEGYLRGHEEAEFLADINRSVYEAMLAELEDDERR
jgi:dCTP deaminase